MAKKELSQAAEKVAAADKKKEKKPANPDGNIFVRAGKAIKKFCKDLKGETKKIVWPDAKTVLKSTGVVLVVVIICALIIGGIDWLLSQGISLLERAAQSIGDTGAETVVDNLATTAAQVIENHGDHTHVAGMINFIG
jgi:preprotein translocase subunit SecE